MDTPFLGQIVLFAGNFAPRGWSYCQGQIMQISTNTALFSILGTTYGGNGQSTFGLPDLRSRVPVGTGQGAGLSPYILGETTGTESVSLLANQMPTHNHNVMVSSGQANTADASNNYLAIANGAYGPDPVTVNAYNGAPGATLGINSISIAGGSQPHTNIQPSLGLNYIICVEGLFPTRN